MSVLTALPTPLSLSPRLLQDASLSSDASSHAMDALKTQLHQTEEQLAHEREAGLRAKVLHGSYTCIMVCSVVVISGCYTLFPDRVCGA